MSSCQAERMKEPAPFCSVGFQALNATKWFYDSLLRYPAEPIVSTEGRGDRLRTELRTAGFTADLGLNCELRTNCGMRTADTCGLRTKCNQLIRPSRSRLGRG